MPYKTNSDFKCKVFEYNDPLKFGKPLEILGYRSIKQQIQSFTPMAGDLTDDYFDTSEDDPKDDPTLGIRDLELAEIGELMLKNNESLTGSAAKLAEIQSQVENQKQVIVGDDPKSE